MDGTTAGYDATRARWAADNEAYWMAAAAGLVVAVVETAVAEAVQAAAREATLKHLARSKALSRGQMLLTCA